MSALPKNGMPPIHPGEVLREEFLAASTMSANALAQAIHVPANRVSQIVAEKRAITADTALRLSRYFGTTPDFWLNMQKDYELRLAEESVDLRADLRSITPRKPVRSRRAKSTAA
jgi:addiction module HigA family antidote